MAISSRLRRYPYLRATALAILILSIPLGVRAAILRVTDFVDDTDTSNGTCTLREAILAANTNLSVDACGSGSSSQVDRVLVSAGTHLVDLSGAVGDPNGQLEITEAVVLAGAAADYSVVQALPGANQRLLEIRHASGRVSVERLALRGGDATNTGFGGGILYNRPSGDGETSLHEVELTSGKARIGGGIYNTGPLAIDRSRVVGNEVVSLPIEGGNHGGGVFSGGSAAQLVVLDSEIVANEAHRSGGGVYCLNGLCEIARSKINDNVAGSQGGGLFVASDQFFGEYLEIARNRASEGAGIHLGAMVELQRSTLVDNVATSKGGGVYDGFGAFIRFSTITGNSAPFGAGVYADTNQTLLDSDTIARNLGYGIHNVAGVFLENTIVAENTIANCGGEPVAFGAYNMDSGTTCGLVSTLQVPNFPATDPMLDVLRDNGGPTPTLALLPGSPAIDVVSTEIRTNCEKMVDQRAYHRGRPRTQNANDEDVFWCDIGAFEASHPFVVDSLVDAVDADPDDDLCRTVGGECTLRAAIQQANEIYGRVEVWLGPGHHVLTIPGADEGESETGDLDVHHPITIVGAGVAATTIDAGELDRVFDLGLPENVIPIGDFRPKTTFLRDLRIVGGDAGDENGAGILARDALRVENLEISGNRASRGSAIASNRDGSFASGSDHPVEVIGTTIARNGGALPLYLANARVESSSLVDNLQDVSRNGGAGEFIRVRMRNSTVSGNHASATGAFFAGSAIIENSTIYDNTADFESGGVFLLEHSIFRNTIIANNVGEGRQVDNCSMNPSASTSFGYNISDTDAADCALDDTTDLTETDPELAALTVTFGLTATHEPLPGSLAIDGGDDAGCPTYDQRGLPRPLDGDEDGSARCDVGAVEVPEPAPAIGLLAGAAWLLGRARRRA